MKIEVIILAAGQGTRMRSSLPKVLHQIGGRAMLAHLLETVAELKSQKIHVVVGHGKEQVKANIQSQLPDLFENINWVEQKQQLGTGHAVMQALPSLNKDSHALILNGDTPLLSLTTLKQLTKLNSDLALLTINLDDPDGMGRVVRDIGGDIVGIIEHKDASEKQRSIQEINTNCMLAPASKLSHWLSAVKNENAQNEYYLPDIVTSAVDNGDSIDSLTIDNEIEALGINNKIHLAQAESYFQHHLAQKLMLNGVTIIDPKRINIRGHCDIGHDTQLDVNVILEGNIRIGKNCHIGANCIIKDSHIEDNCLVHANSIIEGAHIEAECEIGPFARIRPQTHLKTKAKIGNFVEVKNSHIGQASKANHLSYIGDTQMGDKVNIGAGTITCNYDGANKHQTVIEDNVFVGSDSQLIAPVTIKSGATIGAGSTITQDVEENMLAINRTKQRNISDWKRPVKKEN